MTASVAAQSDSNAPKLTYPILVEPTQSGCWTAQVVGWAESRVESATRSEALHQLQQRLSEQLANSHLVHLEVPAPQPENPWLAIAGLFKDDPQFDEVIAEIERDRQELDAEFWGNEATL